MNLKLLSTQQLDGRIKSLAQAEREILHDVILTVKEIDSRKMYFEFGYPNLFEYLVDEVKYLGGTAQRRIDAARLLREVPEVAEKIKSGELGLGQITLVRAALRKVQKKMKKNISSAQKIELVNNISNMTQSQTEKEVSVFLDLPILRKTKKSVQADGSVRYELTLSAEENEMLEQSQGLLSHAVPTRDIAEYLIYLTQKVIKQKTGGATPKAEKDNEATNSTATEAVKAIPLPVRKAVMRAQMSCQHKHPVTGKVCGSTWFTQIDHRQSRWAGGSNHPNNLRVFCASHNQEKYRKEANIKPR